MGARICKLITESILESSEIEDELDLECGESDPTTWDSSNSSSVEEFDAYSYECIIEPVDSSKDPYIVEKRFIAGSNKPIYNIIKRK
ncbi:unnamed protein product [Caenorhabditis sp. 36 PRJEB53466]|nr:unnamed protein product [Caenorhabditis sp. 36 PRJEB53466]